MAQDHPILHYTTDDGLPSNKIYNIYRDSKNYLWIATDKGVARYNGVRFEVFTTDNGLPDNEIFFVQEDPYGRLWLATYNGKLCFYRDGIFHTAENTSFLKQDTGKNEFIRRIIVEKDSSVTFMYWDVIKYLNIDGEHCTNFAISKKLSDSVGNVFVFVNKTSKNSYRLYTTYCTLIIDSLGQRTGVEKSVLPARFGKLWGGGLSQDQSYFFDEYFIIRFTHGDGIVTGVDSAFVRKNPLLNVYRSGGDWFFCTDNGLFVNYDLQLLKGMVVQSVTQDIHNNYWVGTNEHGVFVVNSDFRKNNVYRNAYAGKVVFTYKNDDRLLFATDVHKVYSLENGKITTTLNFVKKIRDLAVRVRNPVFAIGSDDKTYCWGNYVAFSVIGILDQQPRVLEYKNNIPGKFSVHGMLTDSSYLYIKANSRIYGIDMRQFSAGDWLKYDTLSDTLNTNRIFCMAKSPDKSIWYAKKDTLFKIENKVGKRQMQFEGVGFKMFDFFSDYLVGYTHDNKLLICRNYNSEKSLIDTVKGEVCIWDKFYKIDSTRVLIQTNGLYRLLTLNLNERPSWKIWALESGFLPLQAEAVVPVGDKCFFFKNGSITSVDLQKLVDKAASPQITFLLLRNNKGTRSIDSVMEMPYADARNLVITFSILSRGGTDVSCQYCVSKDERDNWIDLKGEQIDLINSGYGTYKIKVRAKSTSSDYSEPFFFTLHVLRPYWATWWFITLCVCVGLAIIGVAIRLRILFLVRKSEKEHDTEIKFMRSEYKAINALMNPHFIFNTLNNVQSLFNANDKLAANEYLRIFADLIRQNMHNVSKEMIPLQKEMVLVMNYLMLEKLRFEDKLNYNITVDESIDLSDILIPPLLIQPLVENSIKHGILPLKGSHGIIEINVFERNGILYVEVRDNGMGMSNSAETKSELHESFGMSGIKKRIEQLSIIQNKEIAFNTSEVKDENGKHLWTVVTISMPIS